MIGSMRQHTLTERDLRYVMPTRIYLRPIVEHIRDGRERFIW